jgi:hypothetical protein
MKACGVLTVVEERNVFRGNDPDNGKRPDISAFNLPTVEGKVLFDVTITSPISSQLTSGAASTPFRAAECAYSRKIRQYQRDAEASSLGFQPIVFETTGIMHPKSLAMVEDILKHSGEVKGIPFAALKKYWLSTLQIALIRGVSSGIVERCYGIYGRGVFNNYLTHIGTVSEFEYVSNGVRSGSGPGALRD